MPAFGEVFTLVIDGNHQGQNCVNVLHGRVRSLVGTGVANIVNDFATNNNTGFAQPFAKVWLDRCHEAYRIDRVYCKAGVDEASIAGSTLYNGGEGIISGPGTGYMCGHAAHLQLAASSLKRKYARGCFFPLTAFSQVRDDSYVSSSGIVDLNVIGSLFLGWNNNFANNWYFYVEDTATTSKGIVDEVSFVPLVTLMERRSARSAP